MDRRVVAVVPAAGTGLRMGGSGPKQFLALGGEPLVVHSLRVLQSSPCIDQIILAVPLADLDYCLNDLAVRCGFSKITKVVAGGRERQDSVRHALEHVPDETEIVVVHDAVRPFLTEKMVAEVVAAARRHGGAVIGLPMRDLGLFVFEGWVVWAVPLLILGSKHPPMLYPDVPLDPRRRAVGVIAFVIFIVTFIPVPVSIR